MGASLSSLTLKESANAGPGLGDIPENCVACVFLYLSPPEICNLARLNRAFRGAALSDAVWQSKLPSNYHRILQMLSHPDANENLSKKDIFALLSRRLPFDDGNKVLWVDRFTGRSCMSISAKAMSITGIDDRRYWNWIPTEESRFNVVAYLQQIWWFEVDGAVQFPFPPDVYTLSFRIHLGRFSRRLGRRVPNFDHTHGWDVKPVRFGLSTSDGQCASAECFLGDHGVKHRGCWIEYKVGEFAISRSDPPTEIKFSMKQIDCTHSKGGLCVDSVSIVPADSKDGRGGRGAS
ncbi:F-box protein PP2-A15-like [Andrographis paniculata]|uniref:F-box protein PP2-A15-like n=1 Tax=Andrographis paniculata TaxID=175694 RepID=UPI0021E80449|nr:F-box protein PP2-A15-like [Andrographis paniculata]